MKIMVFGLNYKNASISIREKAVFTKTKLQKAYEYFKTSTFVKEAVIISTCNRSEVFAVVQDIELGEQWFKDFYQSFFQIELDELEEQYIAKKGLEAINYLYEVCCGLESLVLGEDQILGQVKEAYQLAIDYKASGKILNRLFLEAISTAKEIKTKTAISENPISISSIAVKQLEKALGGLKGKVILVVGFGEMSRIAIENLLDKETGTIYICNRKNEEIDLLQRKHNSIRYLSFREKLIKFNEIDGMISATGAPHYIFNYDEIKACYQGKKEICIVDMAMPRDLDPMIEDIQGVTLVHIDQLKEVADESINYRKQCIGEIRDLIQQAVQDYQEWYRCLPIYPRIEALNKYTQKMTDNELEMLFDKLSHMEEKDKKLIELVVKSLIKKMWKKPILQMKHAGVTGRGEEVASMVDELFDFKEVMEK